jgi:hypothetical protein
MRAQADLLINPATAKSMGSYEIAGGLLVMATFGLVIGRDSYLVRQQERVPVRY